jgi:hypothetical protein
MIYNAMVNATVKNLSFVRATQPSNKGVFSQLQTACDCWLHYFEHGGKVEIIW